MDNNIDNESSNRKKLIQKEMSNIFHIVKKNEYKKLKQVLQNKNNLDFLWENNVKQCTSIVHVAAEYNSLECLKYLIKRGGARALVLRDTSGWTALHYSSFMGHLRVVKYLLEHGSPILRDNKGKSPIFWTGRSSQHAEIITLLIQATTNSAKGKGGRISSKNTSASSSSVLERALRIPTVAAALLPMCDSGCDSCCCCCSQSPFTATKRPPPPLLSSSLSSRWRSPSSV